MKEIKKAQREPEIPSEPFPSITPEMIHTTFKALESTGMIYYTEGGVYVPTETGWKLLMEVKPKIETIEAFGDSKILAISESSIRITKGSNITEDCIAIRSTKSCVDLDEEFKTALMVARKVEITVNVDGFVDKIVAFGSPALKLTSKNDIIIRKDDFIDENTLAILSDKSASELRNEVKEKLRNGNAKIKITFEIKS